MPYYLPDVGKFLLQRFQPLRNALLYHPQYQVAIHVHKPLSGRMFRYLFRFWLAPHIENAVTEFLLESARHLLGLVFGGQVGINLIQHLSVFMAGRYNYILSRYPTTTHDSRKCMSGKVRVKQFVERLGVFDTIFLVGYRFVKPGFLSYEPYIIINSVRLSL